ncbi:MAG TPA: HlyD family secretion protein [Steroidobacteraceae bacterium]|nr:HlyD family secretion protein [Steroidobacteraceae bacterium]
MSASSNAEHRAARENESEPGRREGQSAGDEGRSDGEKGQSSGGKERGPGKPSLFRRPAVLIGGGIVLLLLILTGALWWWHASGFENTDDAFIDARTVRVAPRISGQVIRVLVTDNQAVHRGDVMVEIDPADTQLALDQATAQQSQAETALGQAQADVEVAEAQRRQALATASGADAQALNAQQDLRRYRDLKASTPQAVAQGQLDQATAAARNASAQRDAAHQQIQGAEAQITAARAAVSGAEARLQTARAQVRQAELNLGYTRVLAPVDGHVARRTVAVGSYVAPGQELLAIVPLHLWVTANFKENQLVRIRPGQSVTVHVDACPAVDLDARVDSIQRGAGQAFALLPAENATGNFVKVVQRVPVKIELEDLPRNCPLGPGMSVEPSVRVR